MSCIGQFKKKVIGNLRSVGTWVKMSLYFAFPSKEEKRKKPVPLLQEPAKTTIRITLFGKITAYSGLQ